MESSILTMAITLTLNIQDIWFATFPEKNYQGQIFYLLYFQEKGFQIHCHKMKNKHIDWILGLKWNPNFELDHVAMTLILNFQGQMNEYLFHRNRCLICYILDKNGWFKKKKTLIKC